VVGYLVNSIHVVSGTQFVDREVVFGKSVSYSTQSIGNLEQPAVLSRPSQRLQIVPVDRFPPAAPENLTAVPLDSSIQLLWDEVTDSELAGYFVYRGADQKQLEKSSPLVNINRYVDPHPEVGSVSYYAVTAVDNYGNESVLSEHVTVTVGP
jgi:fibronectin type 3 domain-containing protein